MYDLASMEEAAARVHAVIPPTPQYVWPLLAEVTGCEVWLKHENHTPTGAFKVRGGINYVDGLKRREPDLAGVIAASTGNHGQSVTFAAKRVGLGTTIVVPEGNNPEKNAAMRGFGAELIEHGRDFNVSLELAADLAKERGLHLFPSYHADLVRGVGSYAMELFCGAPDLDTVYVPIGMGSGCNGVVAARDALGLKTRIIGVVAEKAPCIWGMAMATRERSPTYMALARITVTMIRPRWRGAVEAPSGDCGSVLICPDLRRRTLSAPRRTQHGFLRQGCWSA